jgi:hypothetical protein
VEEDEQEEGYAIGENWDGGLRVREASRSLGGCLGQREMTDIVQERREEEGREGSATGMYLYLPRSCTCNPGFQIFSRIGRTDSDDCLIASASPLDRNDQTKTNAGPPIPPPHRPLSIKNRGFPVPHCPATRRREHEIVSYYRCTWCTFQSNTVMLNV